MSASRPWHVSAARAAATPAPGGRRSAEILAHGTLEVRYYAPVGVDAQSAHSRDEIYIVVAGTGRFFRGGETVDVGPGDFLFVPAFMEHRFEDFSQDFAVWVAFYGPDGGEGVEGRPRGD